MLVQELLSAERDLLLPQLLKKLGRYEALIIDDIGYVQQNREEMEVNQKRIDRVKTGIIIVAIREKY